MKASHIGITKYNEIGSMVAWLGSRWPSKIMAEMGEAASKKALRLIIVHSSFSLNMATFTTFLRMRTL